MTTQELIERIEGLKNLFGNKTKYVEKDTVIKLISELDEPEKVKIPQFVADWYEEHKKDLGYSIWNYIYYWDQQEGYDFKDWFDYGCCGTIQTLFNMHQFGYEVEKEPKYTVKIKGVYHGDLGYAINFEGYSFYCKERSLSGIRFTHTRKELEEGGFGEVFDSPLFEIEEIIE